MQGWRSCATSCRLRVWVHDWAAAALVAQNWCRSPTQHFFILPSLSYPSPQVGRIQCSLQAAKSMLNLEASDAMPGVDVGARIAVPADPLAPPNQPSLIYRGMTNVKGKGPMSTYWVDSGPPEPITAAESGATAGSTSSLAHADSFTGMLPDLRRSFRRPPPAAAAAGEAVVRDLSTYDSAAASHQGMLTRVGSVSHQRALTRVGSVSHQGALTRVGSVSHQGALTRVGSVSHQGALTRVGSVSLGPSPLTRVGSAIMTSIGVWSPPVATESSANVPGAVRAGVSTQNSSGGAGAELRRRRTLVSHHSVREMRENAGAVYIHNATRDLCRKASADQWTVQNMRRSRASVAPAPPPSAESSLEVVTGPARYAAPAPTGETDLSGGDAAASTVYSGGLRRGRSRRFSNPDTPGVVSDATGDGTGGGGGARGGSMVYGGAATPQSVVQRMQLRASRRIIEAELGSAVDAMPPPDASVDSGVASPQRDLPRVSSRERARSIDATARAGGSVRLTARSGQESEMATNPAPRPALPSDGSSTHDASSGQSPPVVASQDLPITGSAAVSESSSRGAVLPNGLARVPRASAASTSVLNLCFDDPVAERRARQGLFEHTVSGIRVVATIWGVSWLALLAMMLGSGADNNGINGARPHTGTGAILAVLTICSCVAGFAWWLSRSRASSLLVISAANASAVLGCVAINAAAIYFSTGPGPAIVVTLASAFVAGASTSPGAGPFEGHHFLCIGVVAMLQGVAHMRLPYMHTIAVCCTAVLSVICIAVPQMSSQGSSLPSPVTGTAIFAVVIAVSVNACHAVIAAYAWEARCRNHLLLTAAAETAEADAMRLLTNLMPPSVVADIVAERQTVPVLATNVVVLVSWLYWVCGVGAQ